MSWSYSGDPQASELDRCRFLIGDTNESTPIMQDEEIQYLIKEASGNENKLRYELFRHASTIFARDIKRSLGPQSEDPTDRLKFFREQMNIYKAKLSSAGISLPKYAHPKVFRRGMQNNPPWSCDKGGRFNV